MDTQAHTPLVPLNKDLIEANKGPVARQLAQLAYFYDKLRVQMNDSYVFHMALNYPKPELLFKVASEWIVKTLNDFVNPQTILEKEASLKAAVQEILKNLKNKSLPPESSIPAGLTTWQRKFYRLAVKLVSLKQIVLSADNNCFALSNQAVNSVDIRIFLATYKQVMGTVQEIEDKSTPVPPENDVNCWISDWQLSAMLPRHSRHEDYETQGLLSGLMNYFAEVLNLPKMTTSMPSRLSIKLPLNNNQAHNLPPPPIPPRPGKQVKTTPTLAPATSSDDPNASHIPHPPLLPLPPTAPRPSQRIKETPTLAPATSSDDPNTVYEPNKDAITLIGSFIKMRHNVHTINTKLCQVWTILNRQEHFNLSMQQQNPIDKMSGEMEKSNHWLRHTLKQDFVPRDLSELKHDLETIIKDFDEYQLLEVKSMMFPYKDIVAVYHEFLKFAEPAISHTLTILSSTTLG